MQAIQMNIQALSKHLKHAEAWEIRDVMFKSVLATEKSGDFVSVIEDLKTQFPGQPISVKAGSRDKNGNISNNAKSFPIVLPTEESDDFMFTIAPQTNSMPFMGFNNVPNQRGFNLEGVIAEINAKFETKLEGLVHEMKKDYDKSVWDIEETFRREKLEKQEEELKRKLEEAEEQKAEYEAKLKRAIPEIKDVVSGLIDFGLGFVKKEKSEKNEKKSENLSNVKGSELTFTFEGDETKTEQKTEIQKTDKLAQIMSGLSDDEKDELFERLSGEYDTDDTDDETEQNQKSE
jgi:hypothetical protein